MEVEEFDFDGEKSTYFTFKPGGLFKTPAGAGISAAQQGYSKINSRVLNKAPAGTDLLFENDVLVSIMVRTQPDSQDETYGLYPRPVALVDGLSPTATRAEVTAFLGNPERVGPNFDRYEVNKRYLHFEFDSNSRAAKLSALLEPI